MSIFGAMNISGSGMTTFRTWLDVIANNIANVNTARPTSSAAFETTYVQAQAQPLDVTNSTGGGVAPVQLQNGDPVGRLVHDPSNPLADKNGNVRMPDVDMNTQMGDLIIAQRAYQANAAVIDRARQSYIDAINIGKGQ